MKLVDSFIKTVADDLNVLCEADDTETMTLEEARAILHKTVREEYARP